MKKHAAGASHDGASTKQQLAHDNYAIGNYQWNCKTQTIPQSIKTPQQGLILTKLTWN